MIATTPRIELPEPPQDLRLLLDQGGVACWEQDVEIATYEPGEPDAFPMFFDQRVYQGSDGRSYPLPFVDSIARRPVLRPWRAIHLENAWIRLMLLPDLGGRIHIGYDKTRGYDFFYRNNVIKPALVGLGGPWVSGGVELNWPQHHRPGTYLPVEVEIERAADGSVTVWHSDLDPMQRMRGTHGIRLRPDEATVELTARLHNRTTEPQTFLWWANVAAAVHEDYQSFFPTDVRHVADHARRAITAFPAADRPYYGVDYPALAAERPGADRLDRYTNIPVPTSYMITDTADEFFGGYDHRAGAGFVHWAERGIAPGKKQWTWGDGEIGRAWDRQLTDGDGPYIELMAGVFTDNQPDFSYLAPGETRTFSQFWYPVQDVGVVHQATREAALSVQVAEGSARVGLAVVRPVTATVRVLADGVLLHEATVGAAPGAPALIELAAGPARSRDDLVVTVTTDDGPLVDWRAHPAPAAEPWRATAPAPAAEIGSVDELLLTAQHLVQYRHPSRSPRPYLERVLEIDPEDSRAHLALAELEHGVGRYPEALAHLDAAAARITRRNLNPRTGELPHRRALVLERLGRDDEALASFVKATWDEAYALPGRLGAARVHLRAGRPERALTEVDRALVADPTSPTARAVRVLALRRLGRTDEAAAALTAALGADPLDPLLRAVDGTPGTADPTVHLTIAHELAHLGERDLALACADRAAALGPTVFGNAGPVAHYLRATLLDGADAAAAREAACTTDRHLAFPAGLDDHDVLVRALALDPADAVALGLLGSLLLGARRGADARAVLLAAVDAGSTDPVVLRNAALATVNTTGDLSAADALLGAAIEHGGPRPRLVFERDQLARLRDVGSAERLAALETSGCDLAARDDLTIAHLGLLLDVGRVDEALAVLTTREFQPFEGGEGRVIAAYDRACVARAAVLVRTDPLAAAALLDTATPLNLGEGRHPADPCAERLVAAGDAYAAAGDAGTATQRWRSARAGGGALAVAPRPARADDYWVGVAHHRLGETDAAEQVWKAMEQTADDLERAPMAPDYFATSLPELLLFTVEDRAGRARTVAGLRSAAARGRGLTGTGL
jgi:tetratricopeptide (TPR) repeat protein